MRFFVGQLKPPHQNRRGVSKLYAILANLIVIYSLLIEIQGLGLWE